MVGRAHVLGSPPRWFFYILAVTIYMSSVYTAHPVILPHSKTGVSRLFGGPIQPGRGVEVSRYLCVTLLKSKEVANSITPIDSSEAGWADTAPICNCDTGSDRVQVLELGWGVWRGMERRSNLGWSHPLGGENLYKTQKNCIDSIGGRELAQKLWKGHEGGPDTQAPCPCW